MSKQINSPMDCPKCGGWIDDLRARYGFQTWLAEEWYCLNCGHQSYSHLPDLEKDLAEQIDRGEAA